MALQQTLNLPAGLIASNAYVRVEQVKLTKNTVSFTAKGYSDSSSSKHFYAEEFSCDYDLAGANPIQQAYVYLKTLPEFAGAADV